MCLHSRDRREHGNMLKLIMIKSIQLRHMLLALLIITGFSVILCATDVDIALQTLKNETDSSLNDTRVDHEAAAESRATIWRQQPPEVTAKSIKRSGNAEMTVYHERIENSRNGHAAHEPSPPSYFTSWSVRGSRSEIKSRPIKPVLNYESRVIEQKWPASGGSSHATYNSHAPDMSSDRDKQHDSSNNRQVRTSVNKVS